MGQHNLVPLIELDLIFDHEPDLHFLGRDIDLAVFLILFDMFNFLIEDTRPQAYLCRLQSLQYLHVNVIGCDVLLTIHPFQERDEVQLFIFFQLSIRMKKSLMSVTFVKGNTFQRSRFQYTQASKRVLLA